MLQCITNLDRESGYNSSLQLPDATLNFAKKHPLMEDKALACPLLLTKGVNFTKLVVDRVSALDQRAYNMLFIGTGSRTRRTPALHSQQRKQRQRFPLRFPVLWAGVCVSVCVRLMLFAEASRAPS